MALTATPSHLRPRQIIKIAPWKIFLLGIFIFFLFVQTVDALTLAPALIEVKAESGESLIQKIQLFNETNQTLTIYPSIENFAPGKDNKIPQFFGNKDPQGAARWITLPINQVSLKPGASRDLIVKIKIPPLAEPGGHYAAILWSDKPAKNVGIGTASRLAQLFLFKIKGEIKEEAKVVLFEKDLGNVSFPRFQLVLENIGNVHLQPQGILEVFDWQNKKIGEMAINPKGQAVLPWSQRQFWLDWPEAERQWGYFSAQAIVRYGATQQELTSRRLTFWLWPDKWIVLKWTALLALIAAIAMLARRRSKSAVLFLVAFGVLFALPTLAVITTSTSGVTTVSGTYSQPGSSGGDSGAPPEAVKDTTAPAAVANLLVDSATASSATLTWTAPGDDNNSGTAAQYSIRYFTSPITTENFDAATAIINAPAPAVAGASQSVVISNLSANTLYYFALKTADEASNWSALSNVASATTLAIGADATPPIISNIQAEIGADFIKVSWQTNELANSQLIINQLGEPGKTTSDLTMTKSHILKVSGLKSNTKYFYTVFSADQSGNQAQSEAMEFTTLSDKIPPANVSNLSAAAGNQKITINYSLPPDHDLAGILFKRSAAEYPKTINDGQTIYNPKFTSASVKKQSYIDDKLTNGVIYYYTLFAYDASGNYASGSFTSATPQETADAPDAPGPLPPVLPGGGAGAITQLQLSDFKFFTAKGAILIPPSPTMTTLAASSFGINLPFSKAPKPVESLVLHLDQSFYFLAAQADTQQWSAEITAPALPALTSADIVVTYQDKSIQVISWQLETLPLGQIFAKINGQKKFLADVKVSLFQNNVLWPASDFYQFNPQITDNSGSYGFLAPVGKYKLTVSKDGFAVEELTVNAKGIVINVDIELLFIPPILAEVIKSGAPLMENIKNVAQNLGEKVGFLSKKAGKQIIQSAQNAGQIAQKATETIQQMAANPEAQKAVENIVAPAVAGAAAMGTTAAVGLANILNYSRFLFTQPFLLFKRRKRRSWGVVYNALTKLPIDLATVRLVDAATGRVAQTRVTDKQGRYVFFPAPGNYRIEANFSQFIFPTAFLSSLKEDSSFVDIYHGETIEVKEKDAAVTVNIPLDPLGAEKPIGRLIWQLAWRRAQHALSIVSILLAAGFAVWLPGPLTASLLGAQVIFYGFFRRLAIPPKPKGWGIVYNETNHMPLTSAIARIFDKQYNKLLDTRVTDKRGRYSFLVGRNEYYVTYERDGFEKKQSDAIDLRQNPEPAAAVGIDMGLKPR